MGNSSFFTDDEQILFLSLYRQLRKDAPDTFKGNKYRSLRNHLTSLIQQDNIGRGHFGLNPIIRTLQTAILAVEDIGMRSDSIVACLLMPFITTEEELQSLDKLYPQSVKIILHGLIHIREL